MWKGKEVANKIINCHICSSAIPGCASSKFERDLSLKTAGTSA